MKHASLDQSGMATTCGGHPSVVYLAACRHLGRYSKLAASESAQNMERRHDGYAARMDAYIGHSAVDVDWV